MRTVNIATLKDHLSSCLQDVKSGTEILVRDRNVVIARIVPFVHRAGDAAEIDALAAAGKLRPGEGQIEESFWHLPAPRVSRRAIRRAVEREREP